jgi:hypothetical protein
LSAAAEVIRILAPDLRRRWARPVSAALPVPRVLAPSNRVAWLRVAAFLAACAAVDAVAAGILLLGTPLPALLEGLAAAVSHGIAVLFMWDLARERPSRRWLCLAAVLAVPFVGAAVATTILVTKGRGSFAIEGRTRARRRPALTTDAIQRLGTQLSPCDALDGGDEEQRRAALWTLSRRRDPEAIALLRRAASSRDPDLALSAALVMDEFCERAEREVDAPGPAEVRHVAG